MTIQVQPSDFGVAIEALFQNREIGVVTDAPAEATKVRDVIAKDFAAGTAF